MGWPLSWARRAAGQNSAGNPRVNLAPGNGRALGCCPQSKCGRQPSGACDGGRRAPVACGPGKAGAVGAAGCYRRTGAGRGVGRRRRRKEIASLKAEVASLRKLVDGATAAGAVAARLWMTRHYSRPASPSAGRTRSTDRRKSSPSWSPATGTHAGTRGSPGPASSTSARSRGSSTRSVPRAAVHRAPRGRDRGQRRTLRTSATGGSSRTTRRASRGPARRLDRAVAWFAENLDVLAALRRFRSVPRRHAELWAARAAWRAPRRPRRGVAAARVTTNARREDRRPHAAGRRRGAGTRPCL